MAYTYGTISNATVVGHGTRSEYQVRLGYQVNSQSIENNTSNITLRLEVRSIKSSYGTYGYNQTTTIDGVSLSAKSFDMRDTNTWQLFGSRTITVSHNSEGSYSATKKGSFTTTASNDWGLKSGSASVLVAPPNIPRYANVTQTSYSVTETGLKINWTTDNTVDFIWYSTNDGTTWVPVGSVDGKNGNFEITGLSPNTLYNVRTRVKRKDSQLESNSSRLQVTTYDYPYCTETPDFTVGQLLTLKLYNPLSRTVDVTFIGANDQELSTDSTAMDTVEGYNSETFVKKLYNSIPNSGASPYKIKVTYGDSVKIRDNNNTYNVDGSKCEPTFNNFTYKDSSNVADITGNDQVLVKGFSTVQVTINSTNKMVAINSASPNKYTATIDGLSASANYSDNDVVIDVGKVTSAGTKRLSVTAYDSRYCRKTVDKDITVLDYVKPVINVDVARLNNFESQTTLKIKGTYDQLLVNGNSKNAIQSVMYRYRETGETIGEWSEYAVVTTTVSGSNFTCNDIILSLDNTKAFEIEAMIIDKLDSAVASGTIDVGEAIFFISSNKKACYINGQKILMYEDVNETTKAIKLEDNYLWDSESVIHNGETLKNVINNLSGGGTGGGTGGNVDINRRDLNEFTDTFVASYGHTLTNTPSESLNLGHLLSIPRYDQEGFVTQYFSPYTTNDVYIRKCEDGTWGDWYLITNNYSAKEQRVGTWIDGLPFYRKVISINNLSIKDGTSYAHGIANVKEILPMTCGRMLYGNNTPYYTYPLVAHSGAILTATYNTTHIQWAGNDSWGTSHTHIFVIYYTKTTD